MMKLQFAGENIVFRKLSYFARVR